jgi:hypothetical protein
MNATQTVGALLRHGVRTIFVAVALGALAQTDPADDFGYTHLNGAITLTHYTGAGGSVTIPDQIDGLPVTSIGAQAFSNNTAITNIVIPNTVTNIGDYAFYGGTGLTNVTLPASVTTLGRNPFALCGQLASLSVDAANPVFSGEDGIVYSKDLTTLVLYPAGRGGAFTTPDHATSLADGAFEQCPGITSLSLSSYLTQIGGNAFAGCLALTNFDVAIMNLTFSSANGVLYNKFKSTLLAFPGGLGGSFTIPASVTSVADGAFANCHGLTNLVCPANLTAIGQGAFAGCDSLASITFNDNLARIGESAFAGCTQLVSLTLPVRLANLGDRAFADCASLASLYFKGSPPTLAGDEVFAGDPRLVIYRPVNATGWEATFGGSPVQTWDAPPPFTYQTLAAAAIEITGYTGADAEMTIPDQIEGLPVTSIGARAFYGYTPMTRVILPTTLTNLGSSAFASCVNLRSIALPDGITDLSIGAFSGCASLTNITFGPQLKTIGTLAFDSCFKLQSPAFPESLVNIDASAFPDCYCLTNLLLPNSLTNVGPYAFEECTNIATLTLSSNLASLGDYAFAWCDQITNVTLPASLVTLGLHPFSRCSQLEAIGVDPANPVFTSWDGIVCNKEQTMIRLYPPARPGEYRIPDSITHIGQASFAGCPGLTRLIISPYVSQIDDQAFAGSYGITDITVEAENSYFSDLDGLLYDQPRRNLLVCPPARNGNFVMPNTVTNLGNYAFAGCGFTSITCSLNLISIGDCAFQSCSALTNVTLTSKLVTVGNSAFSNCKKLSSLTFPASLAYLGDYAFEVCSSLSKVYFKGAQPAIGGKNLFQLASLAQIYRPANASGWGGTFCGKIVSTWTWVEPPAYTYTTQPDNTIVLTNCVSVENTITVPESVDGLPVAGLGPRAFAGCSNLTDLTLPASLTVLGDSALAGCAKLKTVTLPGTLASIGAAAFSGCVSLTAVDLPAGVTQLGNGAFNGCTALAAVTLPETLTHIGPAAFYGCSTLTAITLPNSLTNLDDQAFYGCARLTKLTLPGNLATLGESVFYGCSRLSSFAVDPANPYFSALDAVLYNHDQTVLAQYPPGRSGANYTVPEGVIRIGDYAFASAPNLSQATLPVSLTSLGDYAFAGGAISTIVLPARLAEIGEGAFADCAKLTKVNPNGAPPTLLGENVFAHSPKVTVYYIAGYAGWGDTYGGQPATNRVVFKYAALNESALVITQYVESAATVVVPEALDGLAVTGIGSRAFASKTSLARVILPGTVTDIGPDAFSSSSQLGEIDWGGAVTQIGANACKNCGALTNLLGGGQVTRLGDSAFANCAQLKRFDLGGPLVSIESSAFSGCSRLTNATLGGALASLGDNAFANCWQLDGVVLPETLTNLGARAFQGCAQLSSIALPGQLTEVGARAFAGCAALQRVTFGPRLAQVNDMAFAGCASLQSLILPASLANLGGGALSNCPALTALYFNGNAPALTGEDVFAQSTNAVVYYLPGATGWGETYGGLRTALWTQTFADWAASTGLAERFPNARGEQDDADHDGLTNLQEKYAGTDPTSAQSALAFAATPRLDELSAEDQTPIEAGQFALYFQAVPGITYEILSSGSLNGEWATATTLTATASQKRAVLPRPTGNAFYRVRVRP